MNLRYPSIANHNQFWPIMTSSGQSMPILTNPMPTQGQSDVNLSPQPIIHICQSSCQFLTIHANLGQPDVNPWPIPCQSSANQIPIQGQTDAIPGPFLGPTQNQSDPFLCQSWPIHANPSQSNANFRPFPRAICPFNLGTSVLYGMVPSLLGGWV